MEPYVIASWVGLGGLERVSAGASPRIEIQPGLTKGVPRVTKRLRARSVDTFQILFFLDWERFQASLLQVSCSLCLVVCVPVHRVGVGQPPKEECHLVLGFGPDHEMAVIGHHAIGKDRQLFPLIGIRDQLLKKFIVLGFLKERQSGDRTSEHIKANAGRENW